MFNFFLKPQSNPCHTLQNKSYNNAFTEEKDLFLNISYENSFFSYV